jgi:hypothetical protein
MKAYEINYDIYEKDGQRACVRADQPCKSLWLQEFLEGAKKVGTKINYKMRFSCEEIEEALRATIGDVKLIGVYSACDPYNEYPPTDGKEEINLSTLAEYVCEWISNEEHDREKTASEVVSAYTLASITDGIYEECYEHGKFYHRIGTAKEIEKFEEERERKRLEAEASKIASSIKTQVDSFEFIQEIYRRMERAQEDLDDYNSSERQMEEWMDHRYAGVSTEVTYDNISYTRNQYGGQVTLMMEILEWLERSCPLLMAKWREELLHE